MAKDTKKIREERFQPERFRINERMKSTMPPEALVVVVIAGVMFFFGWYAYREYREEGIASVPEGRAAAYPIEQSRQ